MSTFTQTIAISGGSRGIGRAIASHFGERGWRVAVAARSATGLTEMTESWTQNGLENQLLTCATDLSTSAGCQQFVDKIEAANWSVNLLVNNLGVFAPGTLLEGDEDQLERFLHANLLSAHHLSRALLPQLRTHARAHLMTIGSVSIYDQPAPMAAYMLSKHALHAWHEAVRKELMDTNIHTTLIAPGATYTSSWDGIEVDPNTLLAPQTVATAVWDAWKNNQLCDTEQVILRPLG